MSFFARRSPFFKNLPIILEVNISDTITTTESVVLTTSSVSTDLSVNVSDTITLTENKPIELNSFINKSDTITITENKPIELNSFISTSDSITVTESATPNLVTRWSANVQAWFFPGSPAQNANIEYSDGRQIHVLKPQYYNLNSSGVLVELDDPSDGVNAYSVANAADVRTHAHAAYFTISSSASSMSTLVADNTLRTNAINTIKTFLDTTAFQGVDLDWEGFGTWTATDYSNFKSFVTDLGNTLHLYGYKLQIDGPPIWNDTTTVTANEWTNRNSQGYYQFKYEDFNTLPVDQIVVLAYDYDFDEGGGAPIAPTAWVSDIIDWVKSKVTDVNRIVIGMPSYGYHATTSLYDITNDTKAQSALRTGYNTATRDVNFEMNWLTGGVNSFFQDTNGINAKRALIEAKGIKHISVWHLGGNDWFTGIEPVTIDTPFEKITITENVKVELNSFINVSDTITTTENVKIELNSFINKSDTVTLTENKQIELNSFISPSDTITVTENIKIELNSFVNKSDTVTLTENIVVIIPLQINVSDTITTSENLHIELNSFINTSDTITLTENVKAELNSFVAVSELITITDTPNIALVHQINVNDSITTTENTNIALVHTLQVSDSITITENIKQLLESNIIVSDTITIAESVMDGESMNILITESVSVSENVALDIPLLITVSDTVRTRESYTNSFWFDGITGKIAGVAATPDATSATPVTISFWFRSEREAYVGTNNSVANSQQVINYRFTRFYFRTANNQVRIRTDAAAATEASAPINFTGDATWHHVVGTYNPNNPNFTLKIYTDGVLRTTTNAVTNFPTNNYGIANIVSNQYRGEVADVRIFHSLLTDAEAIEIYTSGANPATKSPVIWFWGDSPDGTTITDISGNGLNGTMSGGAALYQNTSPVAGNAQIQFTTANGGPRDRTTVIDSPSIGTPYFPITTSDNIAVSENIQIDIPITKSISDSITTSESIVIMLESQINTSDNITASETVNVVTEVGLLISVSDRVTVTESPASFSVDGATADRIATSGNTNLYGSSTLSFAFSLNTNQTTGGGTVFSWANSTTNRLQFVLGGSNNLLIVTDISLYGGAWPSFPSISANTTYRFGFTINGSVLTFYINGAKVGSGTYTGNYSWADILPINIGANGAGGEIWDGTIDEFVAWNIVKNDAFFVTDYNTGNVQRYTTDANTIGLYHFDNKLLDESGNGIDLTATTPIYGPSLIADKTVSVTLVTQINASDTITTNDIVQADIPNTITTSDTIALSEVVNETLVHTLATTETIGVSELTLISIIANQNISVQDTVNIDESVVILLPLIITASDAITVNEAVLENVAVEIFVSDNITIAENINLGISDPQISVTDSITVTETPNITIQITIIVSDTITASEALDILHNNTRNLTISNSITVTDTPNIAHVLQIQAISDTIALTENTAINPPHIPDPSPKLILVDGRLAYLLIDSRIPIYTFV